MKISITFDTIAEGLAAIDLLTGGTEAPAAPGTPDPVLGVELDSRGFPWVEAVHAGTKGKNKDGSWKARRGVDDATRTAAEAAALAHLQTTTAPAAVVGNIAVTVTAAPVMPAAAPAMPVAAGMPGMPGLMPAIPPTPLPPISYDQVAEKYGALAGAGKVTAEYMGQMYVALGVDPVNLATDETARRKVYDALVALETA
jgi:hypothetical protein